MRNVQHPAKHAWPGLTSGHSNISCIRKEIVLLIGANVLPVKIISQEFFDHLSRILRVNLKKLPI
jgi:hypothetical protein